MDISKLDQKIKPSGTMAISNKSRELKSQGKPVIGFGAGEPDFPSPDYVVDAAIKAAADPKNHKYSPAAGLESLRQIIAKTTKDYSGFEINSENVIVSNGGKQAILTAFLSTLDPGDEVIIPAPYWVSYPDIILLAGGKPKIVKCEEKDNFKLTPSKLKKAISKKTKWIILNSPSNPTGSSYTKTEIKNLADVLKKYKNIFILSDDIYEHITYDNFEFSTIAEINELKGRTLTMNGVSKSYSMTSWRIGYAAGPVEIIKAISKIQSQSTSNPSSISQAAAVEALNGTQDFISERANSFKERRDFVVESLNSIKGISCLKPEGAFYVFPSCKNLLNKKTKLKSDTDFVQKLLEQANVAVVQGSAFGLPGYFRISYATSMENLKKAMERIRNFCEKIN